jgi:nucleoside-diphosphate-sugar epimerase
LGKLGYDRVNHRATAALAAAARDAGVSRFVFISSIRAQTGPVADNVVSERDTPRPTDAYGRSKLAAERAVVASGVPFTILRPVLVYGPGVKGNFRA